MSQLTYSTYLDVATVLEAFITMWVAHFGMPACITTDRGHSSPLAHGETGVQYITTTAYHPQANG